VRQPLTAIVTTGSAALRFLNSDPPDHAKVRHALERIIASGHRASEVFDGLRTLFLKGNQPTHLINVNRMVSGVLQSLSAELKDHNVEVHPKLSPELPLVQGFGSQLEEVIVNLVRNAIEAMDTTTGRHRVLNVISEPRGDDAIVVAVKDTGPGIDPERLRSIFSSFTTTKPKGTGLGLAICNTIVQRHGGEMTASSDGKTGASFQFILPLKSPVAAAT
jgi:signal transduction histidine kinase